METFSSPEFIKKYYLISSTVSSQQQFKVTADVTRMNEGWIWWIYEMSWIHIFYDYLKRFSCTWCNFSLEILSQPCFVLLAINEIFFSFVFFCFHYCLKNEESIEESNECTLKRSPLVYEFFFSFLSNSIKWLILWSLQKKMHFNFDVFLRGK